MRTILLFCFFCFYAESSVYHFASINYLIEQEVGKRVLPLIYDELGLTITITPLPGKRAQLEASSGMKDGEIMRIYSYGIDHPTMVRVPTPYYYLETMAFVKKDSGVDIRVKDDLAKYKIAKVRGVKHTNNITAGLSNVHDFDTTKQILNLVSQGLADVALTNTIDGIAAIKELGINNVVATGRPLARLDLYHYVNESKSELVPLVDGVIKQMKHSGELEKLIHMAETEVLSKGLYTTQK